MTRLRVLHVLWRLSEGGGIPVVVRQLAASLDADRFDVHIATARPLLAEDGVLDGVGAATLHGFDAAGHPSVLQRARLAVGFARLARSLRADVLHLHSGTAAYAIAATLVGRPPGRVLEIHDAPGNGRHGEWTERIEGWMVRRLGFRPLVHSTSVRTGVAAAYVIPPTSTELVPLGIDTGAFAGQGDREAWRDELGVDRTVPVVLYVARMVPTKNVRLFVEVAHRLRHHPAAPVFALLARGPSRGEIQHLVQDLGLGDRVILGEPRDAAHLVSAYLGSDVFLSTSDYEGFGLAVVEAMAAGLPVVATAVGGVTDVVVDGGTGLLAGRGDADALAAAVAGLLDDPARREAMGQAGRQRARDRFDVQPFVDEVAALYERLGATPADLDVALLKSADFGSTSHRRPERLPYRVDHLGGGGIRLHWTDAPHRWPWTTRPVAAAVRAQQRLTPPALQTVLLAPRMARCPVTLAMFESEANVLAALRRANVPPFGRTRLAVIACWLAELLPRFPAGKRAWYRRVYARVDRLFFFSSNQRAVFAEHLGLPDDRLRFVPFGIDDEYFRPGGRAEDDFVLAVGRDRGRDWATTFAAVRGSGLRMKVLCRRRDLEGVAVPSEVEVLGYVDRATYRDLLDRARSVVVATHDRAYPTGQSVFLEAMAMAKPCVVTRTDAMADYLLPGVNALVVPLGDPAALRRAMVRLHDEPELRRRLGSSGAADVRDRLTARHMWAAIGADLRLLAARR